jgi:hypothetical protein
MAFVGFEITKGVDNDQYAYATDQQAEEQAQAVNTKCQLYP